MGPMGVRTRGPDRGQKANQREMQRTKKKEEKEKMRRRAMKVAVRRPEKTRSTEIEKAIISLDSALL